MNVHALSGSSPAPTMRAPRATALLRMSRHDEGTWPGSRTANTIHCRSVQSGPCSPSASGLLGFRTERLPHGEALRTLLLCCYLSHEGSPVVGQKLLAQIATGGL